MIVAMPSEPDPSDRLDPRLEAEFWLDRHRPDRAEAPLRQALAEDPDDVILQLALADVVGERGDSEAALELALRAVAQAPDEGWVHAEVARIALDCDHTRLARRHARAASRLAPHLAESHVVHAFVLARAGRGEAAIERAQVALTIDPDRVDACCALAVGHLAENRVGPARAAVERALAIDPGDPRAQALLGLIDEAAGQRKAAQSAFLAAARVRPDWNLAHEGLADAARLRHPVRRFAVRLRYALSRVPRALLMGSLAVLFIAVHPHLGLGRFVPAARPWCRMLQIALLVTGWLVAMSAHLADVALLLRRDERHMLTRDERRATVIANGVLVVVAALASGAFWAWWVGAPEKVTEAWTAACGICALVGLIATHALDEDAPRSPSRVFAGAAVLAACSVVALVGRLSAVEPDEPLPKDHWTAATFALVFLGALCFAVGFAYRYFDSASRRIRSERVRRRR